MSQFPWGAAATVGGGLLSAGGGVLGAQSANRAARAARDFYDKRTGEGYQRAINLLYGPQAGNPADWSKPGGAMPTPSSGSVLGRQGALAGRYAQGAAGIKGSFDQGVMALDNLYGASEGLAAQFGRGGEQLINEETDRSIKEANQLSGARLAATGFGNSTARANQASQNTINARREGAKAKIGLRGQALNARLGVRGQRAGAAQANLGRRVDLYGNLLNNQMGYEQLPINTELNFATSGVANPWLGRSTSEFYPGYSPSGTALTNVGNAAATWGASQLYGQGSGSSGGGAYLGAANSNALGTNNPYGFAGV